MKSIEDPEQTIPIACADVSPRFTLGPWKAFSENGTIAVRKGRREVIKWTGFDSSDFQKNSEANAQLIAAAPEMYAALKLMLESHFHSDRCNSLVSAGGECVCGRKAAQAALRKAEGR